jgi:Ca-activated chloride channel homolog
MIYDVPQAAYALSVLLLIFFLYWHVIKHRRLALQKLGALTALVKGRSKKAQWVFMTSIAVVWIAATVALMQPKSQPRKQSNPLSNLAAQEQDQEKLVEESQPLPNQDSKQTVVKRRKAHDVVFLLDVSASMQVNDTRTNHQRLEVAKEVIDEVVGLLDGQAVSLYGFTSELVPLVPSSVDYLFLRLFLRRVGINEGDSTGTDLIEALDAVQRHHARGGKQKNRTLVLLTDGGDTRVERAKEGERQKEIEAILSRLESHEGRPGKTLWTVHCIGLGSKEGMVIPGITFNQQPVRSTLDEDLLMQVSKKGGGSYYFANSYSALAIAQDIISKLKQDESFEEEKIETTTWQQEQTIAQMHSSFTRQDLYFQVPLALAIILLTLELLLPSMKRSAL